MNRRHFLAAAAATTLGLSTRVRAQAHPTTAPASGASGKNGVPDNLAWHDVRDWGVEGKGFSDTEDYFDRLPARAKGVVRSAVWNLSRDSTGMSVDFETDATEIYARYTLRSERLALPHMPATGVSGLDLYGRLDDRWQWLGVTRPTAPEVTAPLASGIAAGHRRYRVYLPLYNGVRSLAIGVASDASFQPVAPRKDKPILFYGTSITHGASASRPGLTFVNLLGRRLDRPMLNFGFSGNGRMELEVGRFLAELDPAVYVIDCLANMQPDQIAQRTRPLVQLLRSARPNTPILLLEQRAWANSPLIPDQATSHAERCAALRQAFDVLVAEGLPNVHYRTGGDELIGADGEGTTDGSHPNDLGMMRYADALEPTLRKLL